MEKNPAQTREYGLGPVRVVEEDFGAIAPAEYKGHPVDGSNPSIAMPPFPPTKGA